MSLDMFLADVKRAALEAVNASKPFALTFGTVISASPLKVQIDQKLTLSAAQLILTSSVRDYTVEMTVDHSTEKALENIDLSRAHSYTDQSYTSSTTRTTQSAGQKDLTHTHAYKGKKKFTVHLGLKVGEKVILLRADGGKQYIVLDRVEEPKL